LADAEIQLLYRLGQKELPTGGATEMMGATAPLRKRIGKKGGIARGQACI
jgi:hypothetical protein